jgi:hypothetical protein
MQLQMRPEHEPKTLKAFVIGLLTAVILAGAAGYVLERYFSLDAEMAFSTSSARVGEESSVEARGWFPG